MPQAAATRPPNTTTATWSTAPMIRSTTPRPSAMAPVTSAGCGLVAGAGGAGADGPGMGAPGIGDPGTGAPGAGGTGHPGPDPWGPAAGGTGPGGTRPGRAWADAEPDADHQMVAPGGAIVWLSCGIGPVPARPSGADSGGGAGREPAAIFAVAACAAPVAAADDEPRADEAAADEAAADEAAADEAAADEAAADEAAADEAGMGVACGAAGGVPWDHGCAAGLSAGEPAAGEPAAAEPTTCEPATAEPGAATGFLSHQRCSTGIGCRAEVTACWSRVISRLLVDTQSGSQHSCSLRTSSSTCGSPIAANCFQASVLNGGKKSFLANNRFLEL